MSNYNGIVKDLTSSFASLRTQLLPRVDSERYGISDDFKSLFSIFKLKLSVDPQSLLALNPSDELDSVPKLCPECNGPLFMLFRKPKLCPCCKKSVLCDSCFQKHPITIDLQADAEVRPTATFACPGCIRQITILQDRARITRTLRSDDGASAAAQDGIAAIYPEIARLIDIGERRLARFRDLCGVIHDSGAPEVSEVNGVVDQIKLCRAQVQGYVGKLRELKYPERSSRQRMQDNLSIYAFEWLNTTRAEFTALTERLREALLRKPAMDPGAPQIETVIPMIAPLMGASPLLIRGKNLPPGTQVLIQGSLCRVVSRTERPGGPNGDEVFTEIAVLSVPSKKIGVATVSVVAPDGKSADLEGFCYVPNEMFTESDVKAIIAEQSKAGTVAPQKKVPAEKGLFIEQVSPAVLPTKGGKIVIKASGVKEGVLVEINSKVITPASVSVRTGEIVVKAPKCKVGSYAVKITNSDGESYKMDGILFYSSTIKTQYAGKSHRLHRRSFKNMIKGSRGTSGGGGSSRKKDGDGNDSSSSSSDYDEFDDFDSESEDENENEANIEDRNTGDGGNEKRGEVDGFVIIGCEKPKTLPPMPPSMTSPSSAPAPAPAPVPQQVSPRVSARMSGNVSTPSNKPATTTTTTTAPQQPQPQPQPQQPPHPQRRVWGKVTH